MIGSGLGRDKNILNTVSEIILSCKKVHKPLVIDADGLFLITQNLSLIKDYKNVILTPNAVELSRLVNCENEDKMPELVEKLGNRCVVLEKAMNDCIYDLKSQHKVVCPVGGSNRRCGGQGDLLAGAVATFYHWALNLTEITEEGDLIENNPAVLACYAASFLIKYR